jgi:Spy/CpxP family protein refolding chaperone
MENRGPMPWPFARLDLTEKQRSRIVAIFESGRPLTDSIMQEVMPRLREINDSIRAEIRDILTPEQVEQLEREFERRGLPREDFGRRWRPGPPPPR